MLAFALRYGAVPTVAGEYSGSLNNAGETLCLVDSLGVVIQEFTYHDAAPWPEAANGAGNSLEVLNVNGDYNQAANCPSQDVGRPVLPI